MTGLGAIVYVGFFAVAALWLFLTSDGPLFGQSDDRGQWSDRVGTASTVARADSGEPNRLMACPSPK